MNATTNIAETMRRARAAALRTSMKQRGTITFTDAELAAWARRGWSLAQITTAAIDLAAAGAVRLTTTPDDVHTIAWIGGER